MSALEIAGLVALVTMATTILFLLRRGGSTRADADLVELWKVAFELEPDRNAHSAEWRLCSLQ